MTELTYLATGKGQGRPALRSTSFHPPLTCPATCKASLRPARQFQDTHEQLRTELE